MERSAQLLQQAKETIQDGLEKAGLYAYRFLEPEKEEASETIRSIVVVLFPYYTGPAQGNLSLYCRGRDYHLVVPQVLEPICREVSLLLQDPHVRAYADTGPLKDRYLVLRAGLGRIGRNQMMINNRYGSYFFAAYMTLSTPLEPDPPVVYANGISCLDCGACVKACPGQAMLPDGAFRPERCRSGITQKSGALEPWEKEILLKGDTIFGCDVCQLVCPLNRDAEQTPLQTFRENRIESLYPEDLEGLSRREFMKKYEDRAFNWKGPAVLRRNLSLMSERQEESNGDREKIPVRSAAAGETPLQASGSGLHQP